MIRKTQLHYMMFTLSGWFTLARIAERAGVDLWRYTGNKFEEPALLRGALFAIPQLHPDWAHPQAQKENTQRMWPLFYSVLEKFPYLKIYDSVADLYAISPVFNVHDGIHPFWNLGLSEAGITKPTYNFQ